MTGNNKYVLSVYSKWILYKDLKESRLHFILLKCQENLTIQDIRQLDNIGIPVSCLKLTTKQEVLDYILNEVKEFVPYIQPKGIRRIPKAVQRISYHAKKIFSL